MRKSRRDLKRDAWWGVREGLLLTAVVFVAAALVVAQNPGALLPSFLKLCALYLAFAAVGGAFAGLCRPALREARGAALVGSLIGASGFVALMYMPEPGRPTPGLDVLLIAGVLGVVAGAFLGWWGWRVNKRAKQALTRRRGYRATSGDRDT